MCSIEEFSSLVQNCGFKKDLQACLRLYTRSVEWGLNSHVFLGGFFIRAFESCDSLFEASKHFIRLPERNLFIWSAIISAHASNGFCEHAIELYKLMLHSEAKLDSHTFVAGLKACVQSLCLIHGMLIHHHIIESDMELDYHVNNVLLDFYGKIGCMHDAQKLFGRIKQPDVIAWNLIISGFSKKKNHKKVLQLFQSMEAASIKPDNITLANILKGFPDCASLEGGKLVHTWIVESNFDVDAVVWSILIDVYAKCDCIKDARKLFDSISTFDEVMWSTMIAGYVVHGMWEEAMLLFTKMQHSSIQPGHVTFMNVLRVVSETSAFDDGRLVHAYVVTRACDRNAHVVNSLIDMYSKCSSLFDARALFEKSQNNDSVACCAILAGHFQHGLVEDAFRLIDRTMQRNSSTPGTCVWNVIIDGCAENNLDNFAFTFFMRMKDEDVAPDSTTYTALLKACWQSLDLQCFRVMHSLIVEEGISKNDYVGTSLVSIYSKFGKLEDAQKIFSQLLKPDVVCWNSLIEGYAQHNLGEEAIVCFRLMQQSGHKPDRQTVLSVLKACAIITALQEGMSIHAIAIGMSCDADDMIGCSLIDMYARFSLLEEASTVFQRFKHYRAAWNAIIIGSARNGTYREDAYVSMMNHGLVPDCLTYLCLLSACSRLGLVHEGCWHYMTMTEYWNLKPTSEHYGCMVDLWGRVGCLKQAHEVLGSLPAAKSYVNWNCLLHHAQAHGRFDLAKVCLDEALHIEGCKAESAYVLMARFFGDDELQGEFDGVRQFCLYNEWNLPAKAFIEADGEVHTFLVGDKTHERTDCVYTRLKSLLYALRCQGFVPHGSMFMSRLPLNDVHDITLTQFEESVCC
ncbi:hypothetical protein L7F22_023420 [Adiantum nelumboides]|nr:hypothetical protein [Adiantum nelumboides]